MRGPTTRTREIVGGEQDVILPLPPTQAEQTPPVRSSSDLPILRGSAANILPVVGLDCHAKATTSHLHFRQVSPLALAGGIQKSPRGERRAGSA